jgi:uncharacterized protein (DUF342 family)
MSETIEEISKDDVKVVSEGVGKWKVRIHLAIDRLKDNRALFLKINDVKRQLAKEINLPPQLLEFGDITDRKEENGILAVTVDIFKKIMQSGPLALHLLPATSDYGFECSNMIASLDLYVFDSLGSLITEEKIDKLLKKHKIKSEYMHWDAIHDALNRLLADPTPIIGLEVARGEFPDPGRDAKLTFPAFEGMTIEEIVTRVDDRRVRQGQILVQKLPPQCGIKNGTDVRGEQIPAPSGRDIRIEAGRGSIINLSATEITAQGDGLMMVELIHDHNELVTEDADDARGELIVRIKVNPLKIIEGGEELDICTNCSVEIHGRVPAGSRIISSSEIIIKGDIDAGAILQSNNDIHINGRILGGSLTSQHSVIISGSVSGGEITAKEKVRIDSAASDAQIIGSDVKVMELQGGAVIAQTKAVLGKVKTGKNGKKPEVRIGAEDFHLNRVQENKKFIDFGISNLDEMTKVFGDEIVNMITGSNLKAMFLRHARERRLTTKSGYDKSQAKAVMRLLDSTSSIRELLNEKNKENSQLSKKIEQAMGAIKELVILEGSSCDVQVKLGTQMIEVAPFGASMKFSQIGIEEIKAEKLESS